MKLIRNARLYRATLQHDVQEFSELLAENRFAPLTASQGRGMGFVDNPYFDELVTPVPGGIAFTLREDEKVVPASSVKQRLAEKVELIRKNEGRLPGRKERAGLRDEVIIELRAGALTKSTLTTVFYHQGSGLLIVPTASQRTADAVLSTIISAQAQLETRTLHVDELQSGLTTRLRLAVRGDCANPFHPFTVGNRCKMSAPGQMVSYAVSDLLSNLTEDRWPGDEFRVEELELVWRDDFSFRLDRQFVLRGIDMPAAEQDGFEEPADLWGHEAGAQMHVVASMAQGLLGVFAAAPETGDGDADGLV